MLCKEQRAKGTQAKASSLPTSGMSMSTDSFKLAQPVAHPNPRPSEPRQARLSGEDRLTRPAETVRLSRE